MREEKHKRTSVGYSRRPQSSVSECFKRSAPEKGDSPLKKHFKMSHFSSMDCFPDEVLEHIFRYLSLEDLGSCARVSSRWREVVNSNSIWSKMCSSNGVRNVENLKEQSSIVFNAVRVFRDVECRSPRFSDDCYWKAHFKKYKHLYSNWCDCQFTTIQINFKPTYYNDRIVVHIGGSSIRVLDIDNNARVLRGNLENTDLRVDATYVNKNVIFYVQKCNIVSLKIENDKLNHAFTIQAKNTKCNHKTNTPHGGKRLNVLFTKRHIVVHDNKHPCKIFLYNLNTGILEREIDITPEKSCVKNFFMMVFEEKIYVTYTLNKRHLISMYNIQDENWPLKFEIDSQAIELFVSSNFICAKIAAEEESKNCEIEVWPIQNQDEAFTFCGDKRLPVILTDDNKIIFAEDSTIYVQDLPPFNVNYTFHDNEKIVDISPVLNDLLVVSNTDSLELWNWRKGERLQVFYREKIGKLWVDDKTIVIDKYGEHFNGYVLAFW